MDTIMKELKEPLKILVIVAVLYGVYLYMNKDKGGIPTMITGGAAPIQGVLQTK